MSYSFGQAIGVTGTGIGFPGTISRVGERVVKSRVNSNVTLNVNFGDPCLLIPDSVGGSWRTVADYIAAATANIGNVLNYWAGIAIREVQTMYTYPENTVPGSSNPVGYYPPGIIGTEVLERGSVTVKITNGTPQAGGAVYTRVVANSGIAGTSVGDLEAAADVALSTTATATAGSPTLTLASYTGVAVGQIATGNGIPVGSYVTVVNGTSSVTINNNTTVALAAGTPVSFANTLQLPKMEFSSGVEDANNIAEITLMQRQAA